jgi:hypothetical protein
MIMVSGHLQADRHVIGALLAGGRQKKADVIDPVTATAIVAAVLGAATTITGTWLRGRVLRQRAREEARRDHLRRLPPGSRLIDLGDRGLVIEVGGQASVSRGSFRDDTP